MPHLSIAFHNFFHFSPTFTQKTYKDIEFTDI